MMGLEPNASRDESAQGTLAARARRTGMNPNFWYPAELAQRLRPGGVIETQFWNESIALFKGEDGTIGAVANRCAHRHIKLSYGSVVGNQLVCRYHGWSYDRAGALVKMRHDDFGKKLPCINVRSYPVRVRYGLLWFFPGDPRLADVTPLPEIPHGDGAGAWARLAFDFTWKAHHSMVIDNLCNLTHLWVHGRWVPYDDTILADSSADGDRLTLTWRSKLRRSWLNPFTGPLFRKAPGSNESDTFMIYDYPYQSALSNERVRSCNFMLPIDEHTTRVFTVQYWSCLPVPLARYLPRGVTQLGMPLVEQLTKEIFRQDGFTVEAEQRAYLLHADLPLPEPNPMVRRFNEVAVHQWEEWLRVREQPALDPELVRAAARVKVL